MNIQSLKKLKMPDTPGVYFFKKGKDILYIGKATSLRDRTRSYFAKDLIATRGPLLVDMVFTANTLDWQETDSVLEALLLEAELIKKHQPKYNTKEKDNKSFNCVIITREEFPKVLVLRKRQLVQGSASLKKYQAVYGPFTNGMQLREAMKIIRRIFPFIDAQSAKKDNAKFYQQLGLSPKITPPLTPPHSNREGKSSFVSILEKVGDEARRDYKKTISNLKLFFEGKKKKIILNLKKEMMALAKTHEFERADEIKKRIFALEHINDVALIREDSSPRSDLGENKAFRIEAYDIAHMSGQNMVGVMTVVENGEANKSEYKKFIIRTQTGANDTGALEEVLSRRFRHAEWGMPDLVVVDGSTAQLNVAKRVLNRYQFKIPIIAVVKDDKHKAKALMGDEVLIKNHKKSILLANAESHRFAISFYRQKSRTNMLK